jgi:hypothetical protein
MPRYIHFCCVHVSTGKGGDTPSSPSAGALLWRTVYTVRPCISLRLVHHAFSGQWFRQICDPLGSVWVPAPTGRMSAFHICAKASELAFYVPERPLTLLIGHGLLLVGTVVGLQGVRDYFLYSPISCRPVELCVATFPSSSFLLHIYRIISLLRCQTKTPHRMV